MATEQEQQSNNPKTLLEFTQALHKTALNLLNGEVKWNEQKKDMIISMRDMYLAMKAKGLYEKPNSEICADICEILRIHHANENSFAYVRMVLTDEFKDQSKVTFDNIVKRAFKQNKEAIDKDKINLLEPLKREDFDGLTSEEKQMFKTEYSDVIKESKRRIRDNRMVVNLICEDTQINQALVTDQKTFPEMNLKVKSILTEMRTVIKNVKKINRLLNYDFDAPGVKEQSDYDDELTSIHEQTKRLGGMTNQLISLLN